MRKRDHWRQHQNASGRQGRPACSTHLGRPNTGDKLRSSNMLRLRLLHPLVRLPRSPLELTQDTSDCWDGSEPVRRVSCDTGCEELESAPSDSPSELLGESQGSEAEAERRSQR